MSCLHHFVAQSSELQESKKGEDEDGLSNKEDESVVLGKAPPKFEKEGKATLDELQKVKLGLDEEP